MEELGSLLDHMADRIVDLAGIPENFIREKNYEYLLDDDYLVPEGILLHLSEQSRFQTASSSIYMMFETVLNDLVKSGRLGEFYLPEKMIDLIEYSWNNNHMHLLGRFDYGGGIDDEGPKLLEYNADTPTMVPESGQVQNEFKTYYSNTGIDQYNRLDELMELAFNKLGNINSESHHSMLFTTLGYKEDKANLMPIMEAAQRAGFDTEYADLQDIVFDEDEGIFLEDMTGVSTQFDYLYKLVPWEFICFEEPELLDILHKLITKDLVYVLNPPYTLIFQSKQFLENVYKEYPESEFLLKTSTYKNDFYGKKYVEKVVFGRLGENIKIYSENGQIEEETEGDFGDFESVYQEFTELYKDDDGDVYQASMFTVDGMAACLSFRRGENLIIDDDAEFIPHFII